MMKKKMGNPRKPESLPTKGPISGGIHKWSENKARPDPAPKQKK